MNKLKTNKKMPQLDTYTYYHVVIELLILFFTILYLMHTRYLPKIVTGLKLETTAKKNIEVIPVETQNITTNGLFSNASRELQELVINNEKKTFNISK